jgi:hypothetical protein
LQIRNVSGTTGEVFCDYILRMLPPGVQARIVHESAESPDGDLAKELPHLFASAGAAHSGGALKASPAASTKELVELLSGTEMDQLGVVLENYRDNADESALCAGLVSVVGSAGHPVVAKIRSFVKSTAKFDAEVEVAMSGEGSA